jgi:hypothetical protein
MKNSGTQPTTPTNLSAIVGSNDLRDILAATVSLVEPTQEKTQRLLLAVNGTSHHEGSVSQLVFDGRRDEKGVIYYRVSLASVYVGGASKETLFAVSLLLPAESEENRIKVTELWVEGDALVISGTSPSSRTVVKPVPLPHPR